MRLSQPKQHLQHFADYVGLEGDTKAFALLPFVFLLPSFLCALLSSMVKSVLQVFEMLSEFFLHGTLIIRYFKKSGGRVSVSGPPLSCPFSSASVNMQHSMFSERSQVGAR